MSEDKSATTALTLRVIETKPAVVTFNYQEISDHLDSVLSKYKGLVFTENTVADCKKTIAELRKGQKSLDEFRKATKKQLTESITTFENQCKKLYSKFDEVITPLTKQHDQFELDRRDTKRLLIQGIIDALITEQNLTEKYAARLVIQEEYLNKGTSIKGIKAELSFLADGLRIQQDKEVQDIDLIQTIVELANAQYQLVNVLLPQPYLRLLENKSVAEIDALITSDAQGISAREKKVAEAAALTAESVGANEVTVTVSAPDTIAIPLAPDPAAETIRVSYPVKLPTASQTPTFEVTPATSETITAVYEVTGTEEQLSVLEEFLNINNYIWTDRPE